MLASVELRPQTFLPKWAEPKFSRTVVTDLGASDPIRASIKMAVFNRLGEREVYMPSRPVTEKGVASSDEFVAAVGQHILEQTKGLPNLKADPVDHLVFFGPGPAQGNVYATFANILSTATNKGLTQVDFNPIWKQLEPLATPIVESRITRAANDMFGVGSAMVDLLAQHPKYSNLLEKDGTKITVAMTGGGCGVIDLEVMGNQIQLNGTERGHSLSAATSNPMTLVNTTVEQSGASSVALLRNFARALKYPFSDAQILANLGDVRILTEPEVVMSVNNPKVQAFRDSHHFTELSDGTGTQTAFKLKGLEDQDRRSAAYTAIKIYMNDVAQMIHTDILKGVNACVLTGPLVQQGIKPFLEKHRREASSTIGVSPLNTETLFDALLNYSIDQKLDEAGRGQRAMSGFQLITDLELPDNTIGGLSFSNSTPLAHYANRYRVPKPELKTEPRL